jgi:hypothetical protein
MGEIRFTVVSDGRLRQMATCEVCGAVLTPDEDEHLIDAIELHSEWHRVMELTAEEIKAELREQGWEL